MEEQNDIQDSQDKAGGVMKIKYTGPGEVRIENGIGIMKTGDEKSVPDDIGRELVINPDFEEVVEKTVSSVRGRKKTAETPADGAAEIEEVKENE